MRYLEMASARRIMGLEDCRRYRDGHRRSRTAQGKAAAEEPRPDVGRGACRLYRGHEGGDPAGRGEYGEEEGPSLCRRGPVQVELTGRLVVKPRHFCRCARVGVEFNTSENKTHENAGGDVN